VPLRSSACHSWLSEAAILVELSILVDDISDEASNNAGGLPHWISQQELIASLQELPMKLKIDRSGLD
jgi:hypothetical protein